MSFCFFLTKSYAIVAEDEIAPLSTKEQPKSKWDDEDVDDTDIKESWEDEDEPPQVWWFPYNLVLVQFTNFFYRQGSLVTINIYAAFKNLYNKICAKWQSQ